MQERTVTSRPRGKRPRTSWRWATQPAMTRAITQPAKASPMGARSAPAPSPWRVRAPTAL